MLGLGWLVKSRDKPTLTLGTSGEEYEPYANERKTTVQHWYTENIRFSLTGTTKSWTRQSEQTTNNGNLLERERERKKKSKHHRLEKRQNCPLTIFTTDDVSIDEVTWIVNLYAWEENGEVFDDEPAFYMPIRSTWMEDNTEREWYRMISDYFRLSTSIDYLSFDVYTLNWIVSLEE